MLSAFSLIPSSKIYLIVVLIITVIHRNYFLMYLDITHDILYYLINHLSQSSINHQSQFF